MVARLELMIFCVALVGCASQLVTNVSAASTASAAPTPKMVYYKTGATQEEFERTRARCLAQAETAKAASTDPNPWARLATWMAVNRNCMRADGWVLVPERPK
jgi:hypothetical protein